MRVAGQDGYLGDGASQKLRTRDMLAGFGCSDGLHSVNVQDASIEVRGQGQVRADSL